jgi:hypothetical protein
LYFGYLDYLENNLLSLRDCVVIMMKGRYGRDRQSGSSALGCGHLELWVTDLGSNAIFSRDCIPVADR